MYWILILVGVALTAGGVYVIKAGRDRSAGFTAGEDGGNPEWVFRIFYMSYYLKYQNDKKHRDRFPDNYYQYLVTSGLATALAGAMIVAFSLMSLLK